MVSFQSKVPITLKKCSENTLEFMAISLVSWNRHRRDSLSIHGEHNSHMKCFTLSNCLPSSPCIPQMHLLNSPPWLHVVSPHLIPQVSPFCSCWQAMEQPSSPEPFFSVFLNALVFCALLCVGCDYMFLEILAGMQEQEGETSGKMLIFLQEYEHCGLRPRPCGTEPGSCSVVKEKH